MDVEQYGREVGQRLREVRAWRRLSLAAVAERSGKVGAATLGTYERGERAVTVEKLSDLAGFYGVPTSDLLPEVDLPEVA